MNLLLPIHFLLDLIYPPRCVLCEAFLEKNETDLCRKCRMALSEKKPVENRGEFFSRCISAYPYEGELRDSILRYKFSCRESYCHCYGRLLASAIGEEYRDAFDLITWVPVSRNRRRKRSYDQAKLLSRCLARELRGKAVRTLRKTKDNPPQSGLSDASMRSANVRNVYQPVNRKVFSGKRVLLIDDIVTTGATLSECSRVLLMAGADQVICATLAAAPKKR